MKKYFLKSILGCLKNKSCIINFSNYLIQFNNYRWATKKFEANLSILRAPQVSWNIGTKYKRNDQKIWDIFGFGLNFLTATSIYKQFWCLICIFADPYIHNGYISKDWKNLPSLSVSTRTNLVWPSQISIMSWHWVKSILVCF